MGATKDLELKEFALRVERICDFFLNSMEKSGTDDRKVLEDLKEDAANIQFDKVHLNINPGQGLHDYIHGA